METPLERVLRLAQVRSFQRVSSRGRLERVRSFMRGVENQRLPGEDDTFRNYDRARAASPP